MTVSCIFCNTPFEEAQKQTGRQKYCSPKCRSKDWVRNHKERYAAMQKKSRLKKKIFCRHCNHPIKNEDRASGKVFCSSLCQRERKLKINKKRRAKIYERYNLFKMEMGCVACGYNKCGAALDFHHKNPEEKKFRITERMWHGNTEYFQKELAKCILVCKNCHAEIHDREREENRKNNLMNPSTYQ